MTTSGTSANQHPDIPGGMRALSQSDPVVYGQVPADKALYSRFVQRLHRRYAHELALLPPGLPDKDMLQAAFNALQQQGHDTGAALRILRQLVLERLSVLDCDANAALEDISRAMTTLAEFALDTACGIVFAELDQRHGAPLKADGQRANLWVVGMGKLGARELNVSSDIDIIYVYETDGNTAGRAGDDAGASRISFQEYFSKAVKRIYTLIGETTEHGFVFRMDLALRPNGNSGPPVSSLSALGEYLQVQGREWERFAWMKSRIVAPQQALANGSGQLLRGVVLPFVFRRYLDYNVFEALRTLHDQIREHAITRSSGRPERANDVKISRGGIREIEFIVQLLQVVRGGQYPELRVRPTLHALTQLARGEFISHASADALAQAYVFLRRVEHRIQYLDDQQTHILPTDDADLLWIAQTLGYADTCRFLHDLLLHRDVVAREFDVLLSREKPCKNCGTAHHATQTQAAPTLPGDDLAPLLALLGDQHPTLAQRLTAWREHTRIASLRPHARQRLLRLMQQSLQWLMRTPADAGITEAGVLRLMDWLQTLLRRESYLAMLLERPTVHERLLRLLGAARWPASYLTRNPGVVDELANDAMFTGRFQKEAFLQSLSRRLHALQSTGEDDEETLLNLLRRAMHAETFRTLARDLDGNLTVEEVGDDLSALADAVLHAATHWCWQRLLPKAQGMGFADAPQQDLEDHFAIIAYGKLGGLELGYGSDLDLVFIYENRHERAGEIYAALVRKLIVWLTSKTGEGDLYEIDTALRPNGNSGLLTTSVEAFESYQLQRGSNTAWLWEHQAMTRARCCFGSERLRQRFDAIRTAVISAPRNPADLQREIIAMRERVSHASTIPAGQFDLKHSAGGMIDAEFVTQYLVLRHSGTHPHMLENRGNIALLERADDLGILPAQQQLGHAAASAYRALRHLQHRARLHEETPQCPPEKAAPHAQAVQALWSAVLAGQHAA